MDEILNFIEGFKMVCPEAIEYVFSNGYCYWFAKILELRFGGEIYYNPMFDHFATLINNRFFDINGQVTKESSWISWNEYIITHKENAEEVYFSCVLKKDYEYSPNGDISVL